MIPERTDVRLRRRPVVLGVAAAILGAAAACTPATEVGPGATVAPPAPVTEAPQTPPAPTEPPGASVADFELPPEVVSRKAYVAAINKELGPQGCELDYHGGRPEFVILVCFNPQIDHDRAHDQILDRCAELYDEGFRQVEVVLGGRGRTKCQVGPRCDCEGGGGGGVDL